MGQGWIIGHLFGIPLRIHPSWFLVLFFLAAAFFRPLYGQLLPSQGLEATQPLLWGISLLTALLLFLSVLLHELGHSLVALRQGVRVRSITLYLFGGVASIERECSSPNGALLVAAAGPAVSLLLAFGLGILAQAPLPSLPLVGIVASRLAELNLVLALFNLLPGLPLDGGLILKALVWKVSGSRSRGTRVAAQTGSLLGLLAILLGVWLSLSLGAIGGLWLAVLGWFGLGASRSQLQLLRLQQAMLDLSVGKAMARRFRVLESSLSLRQLSERLIADHNSSPDWLLVCEGHHWLGWVDGAVLKQLPVQSWDQELLRDHLRPLGSLSSVLEREPLWRAALLLEETRDARLLVLSPAGLPSGTLDRIDLVNAVSEKLELRLPAAFLEQARKSGLYPPGLPLGVVARGMAALPDLDPEQPQRQRS
ncbi:MAG: site-2 protease family protein [Aphanocapsa feldmannii 277cV]|uniref:Zinc metalloprotease n=2 Tax=Aphanocapsa feldmannii TaxID=192050 RepID=A0A524RNZ0_9CHRO|nr:MAG: site-2 protease family protein [Aphanocapsa feldmannii 277cV]TGH26862.1 MAG: site-2 protease family protein [Aphanocapsa feldmannii 277cI]